jgi:hypothetical protein
VLLDREKRTRAASPADSTDALNGVAAALSCATVPRRLLANAPKSVLGTLFAKGGATNADSSGGSGIDAAGDAAAGRAGPIVDRSSSPTVRAKPPGATEVRDESAGADSSWAARAARRRRHLSQSKWRSRRRNPGRHAAKRGDGVAAAVTVPATDEAGEGSGPPAPRFTGEGAMLPVVLLALLLPVEFCDASLTQSPQKTRPHARQWWRRFVKVNTRLQAKHVRALSSGTQKSRDVAPDTKLMA